MTIDYINKQILNKIDALLSCINSENVAENIQACAEAIENLSEAYEILNDTKKEK